MKRTAIFISMLVLLLSVGLVSCDAMFQTNLFAKATHPVQSEADIKAKTPDQLQEFTNSATNLQTLVDKPELKTAALESLAFYYDVTVNPLVDLGTPEAQTAAIVAADIAIRTVPDATLLSGSILAFVTNPDNQLSTDSTADVTSMVAGVLPKEIAEILTAGGVMPVAFSDMIGAFILANDAFQALGEGIAGATPAYAAGTSVSELDKTSIAVNAVIAGLLSAVTPMDTSTGLEIVDPQPGDVAAALWIALSDPTTVDVTSTNPPITIDSTTFNALIGVTTDSSGNPILDPITGLPIVSSPIYNLLAASGLDTLFTNSPSTGGV